MYNTSKTSNSRVAFEVIAIYAWVSGCSNKASRKGQQKFDVCLIFVTQVLKSLEEMYDFFF